ncbi:hypothetical protein NKH77_35495 [Streptomyces sp. M19]
MGLTIDVGLPGHVTRHVLPRADETTVRKLMETTAPGVWLKVFVPPETIAPWLAPGWSFDAPGWLMTMPVRPSSVHVAPGTGCAPGAGAASCAR